MSQTKERYVRGWSPRLLPLVLLALASVTALGRGIEKNSTFCNPLNLDYRFALAAPHHRTAADPVIVLYKGDYYLFASASGGYWYSKNLRDWTRIVPEGLPLEAPAPAVLVEGDRMVYTAHRTPVFYVTDDPKRGKWTKLADSVPYPDPAFFRDDDRKVYIYYGAAFGGAVSGVQVDPANGFRQIGEPVALMRSNIADRGWERAGEENLGAPRNNVMSVVPWVEGPWMTKHEGVYYLQYSAPGTIWKTYADGVFTSASPLGGFTYKSYSPFSHKPTGFVGSAGHGAMFRDKRGRYWRVVTMVISVAHRFERRIGIFPAGFDADGQVRVNTYFGDYPQFLPHHAAHPLRDNHAGWMLLSSGKQARASSSDDAHPMANAFDEEIRTYWSARTAEKGEWLAVDLERTSTINAMQINFAEHDARATGRRPGGHQYMIETSPDGRRWTTLIDKSRSVKDAPHDYVQLDAPRRARHVRLTNVGYPGGAKFSVRDLRVFGKSDAAPASPVRKFSVSRDPADERTATLRWDAATGARGYVVRYGIARDKLFSNYQVTESTTLTINSLNQGVDYYFTIDAYNENSVTAGITVEPALTARTVNRKSPTR